MEHNNRRIKIKASYYILSILSIGYFLMFLVIYLPSHSYYYDDKSQVAVVGSVDVFATGFKALLNEQQNNILTLPKLSTNSGNTIIDLTRKKSITVSGVRDIYSVDLNNFAPTNYLNTSMAFFADVNDEDVIVTWVEGNNLYIGERNQVKPGPSMALAFSNANTKSIEYNKLNSISLPNFNTIGVTDMSNMFSKSGYAISSFTLNLGNQFNTSNVTNMYGMFENVGKSSTVFTLDLGNHFDTSNVTNMYGMFAYAAHTSPVFTLNLGSKFNTINVTDMYGTFSTAGYNSPILNIDLGPHFHTSNVINMVYMFHNFGRVSTDFNLILDDNFNTWNVVNMAYMFNNVGRSSNVCNISLGNSFNTSNVVNMAFMFSYTAYNSNVFILNLGNNFNTMKVSNIHQAFANTCYSCTDYTLDLEQIVINNATVKPGQFANQSGVRNIIFGSGFSVMALNNYTFLRKKPVNVYYTDPNFLTWNIGKASWWTTWRGSGNTTFISGRPA